MVAQVAAEDPETAAKIVQPMMFVWSSRPGTRSSHGASPRNMSSESRVRNRISPIHTKSGSAVSVHDEAVPQTVTAIASPAGRDEKSVMPMAATPASVSPIHTPLPRSANSATIRSVVMRTSFDMRRLFRLMNREGLARQVAREQIDEGDREDDRARRHRKLRDP